MYSTIKPLRTNIFFFAWLHFFRVKRYALWMAAVISMSVWVTGLSFALPATSIDAASSATVASSPTATVPRAPCEGEATRTPTPTPTHTPTIDYRSPTPTATATTWGPPFSIQLYWPPNCAVLHRALLPEFDFDTRYSGGAFTTTLYLTSPENGIGFQFNYDPWIGLYGFTPDSLPDGRYYWRVSTSRPGGYGGSSETWEFRIDTRCGCTDTPTPTGTPIAAP